MTTSIDQGWHWVGDIIEEERKKKRKRQSLIIQKRKKRGSRTQKGGVGIDRRRDASSVQIDGKGKEVSDVGEESMKT